jgi:hypothetical protein
MGEAMQTGRRVQLTGLQGRAELNESYGTAVSFDEMAGRWMVRLNGGEVVKVAQPPPACTLIRARSPARSTCHGAPLFQPQWRPGAKQVKPANLRAAVEAQQQEEEDDEGLMKVR